MFFSRPDVRVVKSNGSLSTSALALEGAASSASRSARVFFLSAMGVLENWRMDERRRGDAGG